MLLSCSANNSEYCFILGSVLESTMANGVPHWTSTDEGGKERKGGENMEGNGRNRRKDMGRGSRQA